MLFLSRLVLIHDSHGHVVCNAVGRIHNHLILGGQSVRYLQSISEIQVDRDFANVHRGFMKTETSQIHRILQELQAGWFYRLVKGRGPP